MGLRWYLVTGSHMLGLLARGLGGGESPPLHPLISTQRPFRHRRQPRLSSFLKQTNVFKVEYKHHRWPTVICLGPNMVGSRRYIDPKLAFYHFLTLKMAISAQTPILAPPPPPLIKVFDAHHGFQCRVHAPYVHLKHLVGFRYACGLVPQGHENSLLALDSSWALRPFWARRQRRISRFLMPINVFKIDYSHYMLVQYTWLGSYMLVGGCYIGRKMAVWY